MMTYDDYTDNGGVLLEEDYSELYPKVVDLIKCIIADKVPFWKQKDNLDDYGLDLNKIITLEIDFVSNNGGVDSFNGKSDLVFTSASTSGFSYEVDNSRLMDYHGVPIDPMAMSLIDSQLLCSGLGGMCVW